MNPQLDPDERLLMLRVVFEATEAAIKPISAETAFAWIRKLHLVSSDEAIDPLTPEDGSALCRAIEAFANRRTGGGHIPIWCAFKIGHAVE